MSPKSDKLGRPDALNFTENERVSSAVVHAISDVSLMRKLLVVDDSPVLRKLLKKNFGRYVCHSFPSCANALLDLLRVCLLDFTVMVTPWTYAALRTKHLSCNKIASMI